MAEKEISIILRAKNAMAAGIASAAKSLKAFGSHVASFGKWVGVAFLGAGAAVAGFAAKALSAYAVQQKATIALKSALDAYGESSDRIVPKLQEIASAIQDETGVSDEATLAGMARLKMLGVQTEKLGEAARATVALKSIGMEEAAAQKAVAMAMQGSYDLLNRYVPALRKTEDATEKARIVNELFAKGYSQQKELLGTVSGQWNLLKGRVGDAWEEIGRAIEKSSGLQKILASAGEAVKKFGGAISAWVDSERFAQLQESIGGIVAAMKNGGESRRRMFTAMVDVVVASFQVAAEKTVAILKEAAPVIGKLIAGGAQAVWDSIKPVSEFSKEFASAADKMGFTRDDFRRRVVGKDAAYANVAAVKEQVRKEREAERLKGLSIEAAAGVEGQTPAMRKLSDSLAVLNALAKEANAAAAEDTPPPQPPVTTTASAEQYDPGTDAWKEGYARELKAAEDKARQESSSAAKRVEDARLRFISPQFRAAEKASAKAAAQEAARMERALAAGRAGRTGAAITRAQEWEREQKAAAEAIKKEAAIRAAREKVEADIASATKATAENTEAIAATIQESLAAADS